MGLIRLSKSSMSEAEISAAAEAVRRGALGMGLEVKAFEQELGEFLGGEREVVCVSTGTAALQLAVQACGIGPGDEILVPTLTFVASFQAITAAGAIPVACDVRAADGYLDAADAARRVTSRTKAIMPVHYASNPGAIDEVYELARKLRIRVIEDAAHAFGCLHRGQNIGATGDVVCFSFDGIKNITSGEGGAIVTNDPVVSERAKSARLLGVLKDTEQRYAGQRSWEFDVVEQGWRYHMGNVYAAIGRAQLRRLKSEFAPRRQRLARRYEDGLRGMPGVRTLQLDYESIVPHIFPILLGGGRRNPVRSAMTSSEIETGIHYKPNHLLSFYGAARSGLPVAEQLYTEMLSLPLHAELTDDEQDLVLNVLRQTI
jgi:dTDP-4-amino-4,6-dideoxygalactose transaminase